MIANTFYSKLKWWLLGFFFIHSCIIISHYFAEILYYCLISFGAVYSVLIILVPLLSIVFVLASAYFINDKIKGIVLSDQNFPKLLFIVSIIISIASILFENDLIIPLYYIVFNDFESFPAYEMTNLMSINNLIIDVLVLALVVLFNYTNLKQRRDSSITR